MRLLAAFLIGLWLLPTPTLAAPPGSVIKVRKGKKKPPPPPPPPVAVTPQSVPPPRSPPPPLPRVAPAPPHLTPEPPSRNRTAGWVGLVVSTGLVVAGGVFTAQAISTANQDLEFELDITNGRDTVSVPAEFQEQQTKFLTQGVAAAGFTAAGLSGLVVSVLLLLNP